VKITLEEDGTEVDGDDELSYYTDKEKTFLIIKENEVWEPIHNVSILSNERFPTLQIFDMDSSMSSHDYTSIETSSSNERATFAR
jgi:hypothetical protein